jgi:pilus assembly protein CpaF
LKARTSKLLDRVDLAVMESMPPERLLVEIKNPVERMLVEDNIPINEAERQVSS